jgi:predicted metallopeptidase
LSYRPGIGKEFTGFNGPVGQNKTRLREGGKALQSRRWNVSNVLPLHEEASLFPFVRRWETLQRPLPVRVIRAASKTKIHPLQSWSIGQFATGPVNQPFDFCGHIRRLCGDIVERCETLGHIDVSRLLFASTQARTGRFHGLQARVTPLRFHGGQLTRRRRGISYQVQRYFVADREMLYVVTFCLPRFLDQDFDDKFVTLFHELYHISPACDGDLRRHGGRYAIHSHSKRGYDRYMADLARAYLAGGADPGLHAFLRLNFAQLQERHGSVVGVVVPRPKLIPIPARRL